MARNGSGTYSLPEAAFVFDTVIDETAMNSNLSDIATALTGSIAANGETTISANLPMNSKKLTGMAVGTANGDSLTLGQAQDAGFQLIGSVSGVDTITGALTPAITAYASGQKFVFVSAGANTGAATINLNSVGAKSITKQGATALAAGDIPSAAIALITYDGTQFQLLNPATGTAASTTAAGTVEIATQAEVNTGTDTARSLTPATLKSHLTTPNPIGATTPSTGKFSTLEATGNATLPTIVGLTPIVQVVNTTTGAVATGTTLIVHDDTIPQNTEGDEYMTLAITPTNSSNKLMIEVVIVLSNSVSDNDLFVGLFQDSTANALAAVGDGQGIATRRVTISFKHFMTAGTTSSTTFKVRAGASSAGTTTMNGGGGNRFYGGVMSSSITITEIRV